MTVLPKSRAGPLDRYSYESVAARIAQRTQESLFRFSYSAVNKKRPEWRQNDDFFYKLQKNHNQKRDCKNFTPALVMEFESGTPFFQRHESAFYASANHASIVAFAAPQAAPENAIGMIRNYLFR
jgi:hypothetical protein